jgi:hypothetical protein
VLVLTGGLLVLVGAWAILRRANQPTTAAAHWTDFVVSLVLLSAISLICLWVGFGAGQRVPVPADPLTAVPTALITNLTLGRFFFGAFGVLMSIATIAILILQAQKPLGTASAH